MFSLWKEPTDEITFDGVVYEFDGSFDVVLAIIALFEDKETTDVAKLSIALELLFDDERIFELTEKKQSELLELVFVEHINDGEELFKRDLTGEIVPTPKSSSKKVYSFTYDAETIYASFLHAYNMDLFEQHGLLHWKKFKALLNGLPEDTQFMKIINIRTWKKPNKNDTEEKIYRRLKLKHALPEEVD